MELFTDCDMGSIKIFNDGLSVFFENGYGDAPTKVTITKKQNSVFEKSLKKSALQFLGHFTVKDKAYLSAYDCTDNSIYRFSKGRWFVYLVKPLHIFIKKIDEDLYA